MIRGLFAAAALTIAAGSAAPAVAQSPACQSDLVAVDASFEETLQRLDSVSGADHATVCAALHHHVDVMAKAIDVFERCLPPGHDRGENIGQLQGSIEDFQVIIAEQGCE